MADQPAHRRFGYPILLDLADVPVLVVGAGSVAARKIEGLLAAGARVRVVAPEVHDDVRRLAHLLDGPIAQRTYRADDLDGARLVIVATDRPEANAEVAADATATGTWVNAADDPSNCTFILPAVATAGRFTVAVSTDGTTPAMAGYVRDRIADEVLTPELIAAADEIARQRSEVRDAGGSTEAVDWRTRIDELLPPA